MHSAVQKREQQEQCQNKLDSIQKEPPLTYQQGSPACCISLCVQLLLSTVFLHTVAEGYYTHGFDFALLHHMSLNILPTGTMGPIFHQLQQKLFLNNVVLEMLTVCWMTGEEEQRKSSPKMNEI